LKKYSGIFFLVFSFSNFIISAEKLIDQPNICKSAVFQKAPRNFDNEAGAVVVKNMPRVRSQDSFGNCYAYVATVLAQHNYCKFQAKRMSSLGADLPEKYKKDFEEFKTCQNLSPKNEFSPLHSSTVKKVPGIQTDVNRFSFISGGDAAQTLQWLDGTYGTERCYPSDILVNQFGSFKTENYMKSEQEKLSALHAKAIKAKFTEAEILEDCKDCLSSANNTQIRKEGVEALLQLKSFIFDKTKTNESEISDRKNLSDNKEINKITNEQMNKRLAYALSKETTILNKDRTFEEFLADVIFSTSHQDCKSSSLKNNIGFYPQPKEVSNLSDTEKKIVEILKSDRPIGLNAIAIGSFQSFDEKTNTTAVKEGYHALTASGYYKDSSGVKYIKIQNSWGAEWQDFCTNGGWVKMDSVMSAAKVIGLRSEPVLTWIEQ
jgi:Papain family cysteine protease